MTLTAQQSRVLRWAQRTGKVCTSDFTPPDVCDGGGEITRVPASVLELRDMGYGFERDGTRKGFAVWKLTSVDPVVALRAEPEASMWKRPKPITHFPTVSVHQALPGESADELVQRICNDFHRAVRAGENREAA